MRQAAFDKPPPHAKLTTYWDGLAAKRLRETAGNNPPGLFDKPPPHGMFQVLPATANHKPPAMLSQATAAAVYAAAPDGSRLECETKWGDATRPVAVYSLRLRSSGGCLLYATPYVSSPEYAAEKLLGMLAQSAPIV